MKVLIATEKPFAPSAVQGITAELKNAGHEIVLLEKYTEKAELLEAVKDADAMIVRSDKVTPEVLDAAKQLKPFLNVLERYCRKGNLPRSIAMTLLPPYLHNWIV